MTFIGKLMIIKKTPTKFKEFVLKFILQNCTFELQYSYDPI